MKLACILIAAVLTLVAIVLVGCGVNRRNAVEESDRARLINIAEEAVSRGYAVWDRDEKTTHLNFKWIEPETIHPGEYVDDEHGRHVFQFCNRYSIPGEGGGHYWGTGVWERGTGGYLYFKYDGPSKEVPRLPPDDGDEITTTDN